MDSGAGVSAGDLIAENWTDNAAAWTQIVRSFPLLGDPLDPLLGALRARLAAGGRLLVQTVHPSTSLPLSLLPHSEAA